MFRGYRCGTTTIVVVRHQTVNKHLMHHYLGQDKILIFQHYRILCRTLSTDKWLHTVIATMGSCKQLWNIQEDVAH